MDLKEYFFKKRINPWEFARANKISLGTMSNWLNGYYVPSYRLACVIEKATNGDLTVEEIRGMK